MDLTNQHWLHEQGSSSELFNHDWNFEKQYSVKELSSCACFLEFLSHKDRRPSCEQWNVYIKGDVNEYKLLIVFVIYSNKLSGEYVYYKCFPT